MSAEFYTHFILDFFLLVLFWVGFLYEDKLASFERRCFKSLKINCKYIKRILQVLVFERKKYMLVVLKSPGHELQRIHVLNDIRKIGQIIDAEKIRNVKICKDVRMCYDIEAFNKQKPFGLTDEYASKYYYGDVIFFAVGKDGYPRSLTFKELDIVEQYIKLNRTDKRS